MKKLWWLVGAVVVVVVAVLVGPWFYGQFIAEDDAPAASVSTEGAKLTAGEVTVQVATIATDQSGRDGQFRGNVMDTATFPTATFTVDAPVDLSALPADGSVGTVTAQGTLTLKGQSRPVSVDIDVLRSGDDLIASGSIPVTWTDFGVTPPSLGFVTVDGNGTVDFLVSFARS